MMPLCEVAVFGTPGVKGFKAVHGAFFYEPNGGNPTNWYFGKPNSTSYNPLTTRPLSVIVAGNTTVKVRMHKCPRTGCPKFEKPVVKDRPSREFYWSDTESWRRTDGVANEGIPTTYGDLLLPRTWTVTVDVAATPVLRLFTIYGKLRFQNEPKRLANGTTSPIPDVIELHAHVIDIRGGVLEIGSNASSVFLGKMAPQFPLL